MGKRFLLLLSNILVFYHLHAQCPDRDSLKAEATILGTYSKIQVKERLSKLLLLLKREESCQDPYDSTHTWLLRKIAGLYYIQSDFLHALDYYQKSLKIVQGHIHNPSINPRDQIALYFWLSNIYDSLNNPQQALLAGDSGLSKALYYKVSADISLVRIMYRKTMNDYDIGDYQRCIYDATECEKMSWEYAKGGGEAFVNGMSHASSSLGWRVKALLKIKEFDKAEELIAHKLDEYKKARLNGYVALIYGQRAELQMSKGNYDGAIVSYNQGLHFYEISGDNFDQAQMLKEMGYNIYFSHLKNFEKAMACYKKALQYSGMTPQSSRKSKNESLNILTNMAEIWTLRKNYDSALRCFQLAYSMIGPGTNRGSLPSVPLDTLTFNGKIDYILSLLTEQGNTFLEKYRDLKHNAVLKEAILSYKATDALLERIKFRQTEINSKLFWRKDMHRMYEHAVEAAYLSHDTSAAFYFFERSRAVILNDQITEQRWQSEKEIMEQTQLRNSIQNLQRNLESVDRSTHDGIDWQHEIITKRQRMDELSAIIREKHPLYFQRYLDSSQITLEDTRKTILKDHQALLELFEGDSAVYTLLVTSVDIQFRKIDKKEFDSYTLQCNDLLINPDLLNSRMPEFTHIAKRLYQLIFENNKVPAGRIIISPDGPYFPFEALVTNDSKPMLPQYFLQDHAVSYAYSARFLMSDFSREGQGSGENFLGMAPVKFNSLKSLMELPNSDYSLNQIATYFKDPEELTGTAASKKNFLHDFSRYRIIHLYTHSSDHSDHGEPVIYFSDSALYLSELISARKPLAQLVVLSACETGKGQLNRGEGVFSFNRAFAAIGIPSSIINLWEVEDIATYRLMELFYKYLSKGIPTDIALQKAKLEFIQTGSLKESMPYYWAAAVVTGKTDSVTEKKSSKWPFYLAPAVLVFLLLLGWKKRKN